MNLVYVVAIPLIFLLGACDALKLSKATTGGQDDHSPRHLKNRIIGGTKANAKRYPYYTWLNIYSDYDGNSWCAGSLIANDVILTAAHCTSIRSNIDRYFIVDVWVNSTSRGFSGYEHFRQGVEYVEHPNYGANDIALVFLDEPVSGVPILKLNQNSAVPSNSTRTPVRAIGLGSWNVSVAPGSDDDYYQRLIYDYPEYLQEVTVDTVPAIACIKKHGSWFVQKSMICAADDGNKGTCFGDNGGPLLIPGTSADSDVQVGIVSSDSLGSKGKCLLAGSPQIFTRVSYYKKWIQGQICSYSQTKSSNCPVTASPSRQPTSKPTSKPTHKPT